MRMFSKILFGSIILMASVAGAEDSPSPPVTAPPDEPSGTGTPGATGAPTPSNELPPAQSSYDVAPEVASPGAPSGGFISQAGIGGQVGYGRAGVLELGGSAGFAFAADYRSLTLAPSIGWFIADNLQISALLSISNIKAGDASSTLWSALAEPSYHLPLNRSMFVFAGLGIGASHISGIGTGFAVAPRVGMNFMVGRSGVLSPSLSYQYTTIETDTAMTDITVVALTSAVRFNLGYTVMW